jgi:uncharacterized protein
MKKALKFTLKVVVVLFVLLNVVVMFHAYKFTHFYEAGEVAIKQQKDKGTWDITKEMLFGINSIKQKNIAPDSSYKTIYLITKDGLKLEGWYDTVANAKGSIAMFHGHGSKKSGVLEEAAAFQKMGYNTLLLDFRAHGNSEGNTCTIGVDEAEDVKLAFDYLQKNGEKNIILWGISLGAATITQAVNDFEVTPNKIILEMPFGSLSEAVVGRVKMMGLPAQPISTLLTFWGGVEHGFWAYNMKPSEYAKKIKCPVLLQKGKNDPRVTDAEVEVIFKNISTDKKLVYYENSGHQSLCNNEHEKWMTEVNAFLQK